jgi:hypothetical protein
MSLNVCTKHAAPPTTDPELTRAGVYTIYLLNPALASPYQMNERRACCYYAPICDLFLERYLEPNLVSPSVLLTAVKIVIVDSNELLNFSSNTEGRHDRKTDV